MACAHLSLFGMSGNSSKQVLRQALMQPHRKLGSHLPGMLEAMLRTAAKQATKRWTRPLLIPPQTIAEPGPRQHLVSPVLTAAL